MFPRICFLLLSLSLAVRAESIDADIVIYGGTSCGVAAAVQAHRLGKSAVIVEWTNHLGGLTTGGLGATDIGNKAAIGGIAREFYEAVALHYEKPDAWKWQPRPTSESRRDRGRDELAETTGRPTMWTFEPHVAMEIYQEWLKDAETKAYLGERLREVKKHGARIVEITMESGRTFRGHMFIDASYEGDLMAKAGVSYTVGREANSEYDETLNGVRAETPQHQFNVNVDPYVTHGDPASGLLPYVQPGDGGKPGEGDKCVQAYNYRLCMTRNPANLVPWTELKPANYDERRYELLGRLIDALEAAAKPSTGIFMGPTPMPNEKTDTNNAGAFSTDDIGQNYAYPDGDYATREKIMQEHKDYTLGMLYFLSNSPRVPQHVRDTASRWGLARDEFQDSGNFPPQLYVREARRMVSNYVMTEANCRSERTAEDGIALGAYGMDSHNCQRIVRDGVVRNEGDTEVGVSTPYPISFRALLPKASQAENLLVPVCLSASHIAYGSIRMEPVFMELGQSAATAAVLALEQGISVQTLNYSSLRGRLLAQGQILEWTGPVRGTAANFDPKRMLGIVLDDPQAELVGEWKDSSVDRALGNGYVHDENAGKGTKKAIFRPVIDTTGDYEVFLLYPPEPNRASNTRAIVRVAGEPAKVVIVNQRIAGPNNETSLGTYHLAAGKATFTVTISNDGTNGYVIVDGLQLIRK